MQTPDFARFHLVYDAFARTDADCMPLGNGTMACNVSFRSSGILEFPISRADAWDEHHRLIKLDKIRVTFMEGLHPDGWSQRLEPESGRLVFKGFTLAGNPVSGAIWIDRNHPTLILDIECSSDLRISRQNWRAVSREFLSTGCREDHMVNLYERNRLMLADTELSEPDALLWYHHNTTSPFSDNLRLQHLEEAAARIAHPDPLLDRISGALLWGQGLQKETDGTLVSQGPHHRIRITSHVEHPSQPAAWVAGIRRLRQQFEDLPLEERSREHAAWWRSKHEQSWLVIEGDADAEALTRAYHYQRYLFLCAGGGTYPIRFNGSLFTCDPHPDGSHFAGSFVEAFSPDFRLWGGLYWFQNTRLAYWALLRCGDFEMLPAFFSLHLDNLALARERTKIYFGHGGVYFPETMTIWGTYATGCYGRKRAGMAPGDPPVNEWIRLHYNNTLEMLFLMLEWHAHTRRDDYFQEKILPYAREVLAWWAEHWPRDADGRLDIFPAHSCETYWNVHNPAPDIAGLQGCIERLLALDGITDSDRVAWKALQDSVLPLPLDPETGKLLPCSPPVPETSNVENPECYAIFPFQRIGLGRGDLDCARKTVHERKFRDQFGWQQNGIFAAMVGDTSGALEDALARLPRRFRDSWFPAFWTANYDWAPDQDHGSCLMLTLQAMVLQHWEEQEIRFPACPPHWRVHFRFHTPRGVVCGGREAVSCG